MRVYPVRAARSLRRHTVKHTSLQRARISRHIQILLGAGGILLIISSIFIWNSSRSRYLLGKEAARLSDELAPFLLRPSPITMLIIAVIVVVLIWTLPKLQTVLSRGLTDQNRFDRENEARKTLAQIIGGVFVLASLYSSMQTFLLQRDSQITERFTKAIDQIGATEPGSAVDLEGKPRINLEVRLGGIYALERITHDSPSDNETIMEVLTAYVRENSPVQTNSALSSSTLLPIRLVAKELQEAVVEHRYLRLDIQAALNVIGRRNTQLDSERHPLNLARVNLKGADLASFAFSGLDLRGGNFDGADVSNANFTSAKLDDASFRHAILSKTDFSLVDLSTVDFTGADLSEVIFEETILEGNLRGLHFNDAKMSMAHLNAVDLSGADLSGADLSLADLDSAELKNAKLDGAVTADAFFDDTDLTGASLKGSFLQNSDLSRAVGLSQAQVNEAYGNAATKLPVGLKSPSAWLKK